MPVARRRQPRPDGTTSFGPSQSAPGVTPGSVGSAAATTPNFVGVSAGSVGVGDDVNAQGAQGGSAWYGASSISGNGGPSIFDDGVYSVGPGGTVGNGAQNPGLVDLRSGIATNILGGKGGGLDCRGVLISMKTYARIDVGKVIEIIEPETFDAEGSAWIEGQPSRIGQEKPIEVRLHPAIVENMIDVSGIEPQPSYGWIS